MKKGEESQPITSVRSFHVNLSAVRGKGKGLSWGYTGRSERYKNRGEGQIRVLMAWSSEMTVEIKKGRFGHKIYSRGRIGMDSWVAPLGCW
jgi:hypothetical protein